MAEGGRAARVDDIVKHASALVGFAIGAIGAVVGAVALVALGVVTVGTGGLALVAVAAVAAAGGAVGAGLGWVCDKASDDEVPGVKTGKLEVGSVDIEINGRAAISILDQAFCFWPVAYEHGDKKVVEGSGTVYFACRPASRMKDALICDAKIASGSSNVLIGGPTVRVKGTRRSWVDDVLDYSSVFLVAISCATPGGMVLVAASTGASYGLNRWGVPSWAIAGVTKLMSIVSPVGGLIAAFKDNAKYQARLDSEVAYLFDLAKYQSEGAYAYEVYAKAKKAQIAAFLETGILPKGLKKPPSLIDYTPWVNRYYAPHHSPPTLPQGAWPKAPQKIDAHGKKLFGAALVIDIARVWRDAARDKEMPANHKVSCGDNSWLEPA